MGMQKTDVKSEYPKAKGWRVRGLPHPKKLAEYSAERGWSLLLASWAEWGRALEEGTVMNNIISALRGRG